MVKSSSLPRTRKEVISSVNNEHTGIIKSSECFVLKSSLEFASRSVDIFNKLTTIEINHKTWMSHNKTHESFDNDDDFEKPKEVFKKPFSPRPLKRKANTFHHDRRNRKKWIKYSLADIPLSSDATNSAVALQFITELRKMKEEKLSETPFDDKIVFSKPGKKRSAQIMPQNSVSEGKKSATPENSGCTRKKEDIEHTVSGVKLSHLEDEFDI